MAILEKSNESGYCRKVISAQEEKTITAEFLLSYILPLFTFDFRTWDGVFLFLIFYCFWLALHTTQLFLREYRSGSIQVSILQMRDGE